jgi:hypothetical protein
LGTSKSWPTRIFAPRLNRSPIGIRYLTFGMFAFSHVIAAGTRASLVSALPL